MKFKSIVKKGNNKGACFVILPTNMGLNKSDTIMIKINDYHVEFYAKTRIYYGKLGFYIPANISINNNLLGKTYTFSIEKIDGFFTRTGGDGRIYLPNNITNEFNIKDNDCVQIEANINSNTINKYSITRIRKKNNTIEFKCQFDPSSAKKEGVFKIINVLNPITTLYSSEGAFSFKIDQNHAIIFCGNMVSAIIKLNININKLAHYLGCYFADGTKAGNSWAISASTFMQAKYYLDQHNIIIVPDKIERTLSVTTKLNEIEKLKKNLLKEWKFNAGINIQKFRIHKSRNILNIKTKTNKNGTLIFREHKQIVLLIYRCLLNNVIKKILSEKDKRLATEFIFGVLEGDGYPLVHGRGIGITVHATGSNSLERIMGAAGVEYHIDKKENYSIIRIGALTLMKNLPSWKDKLFKYYPKRRRRTIDRLLRTGAAMFLTGVSATTSPWILERFREKGILNKDNRLTAKGRKIKKALLELAKEINLNL